MATAGGGSVRDVRSKADLDTAVGEGALVVLHFWASWCEASKHMDQLFAQLATDFTLARFLRVEAEEQPEISEAYRVAAVPYFVFFKDGKAVDTLEGADPSSLANKVTKVAGSISPKDSSASVSLGMTAGPTVLETVKELPKDHGEHQHNNGKRGTIESSGLSAAVTDRLQGLINSAPVMLFMKGKPEEPRCGFSRKVVEILKQENVKFESFDILTDDEVRQGLKVYSNWSSYPQVYIKGELIGGSDILLEMQKSGELNTVLAEKGILIAENIEDRLKKLINSSPVTLFMKGTPDAPKCGFSSKVVNALKQEGMGFGSFDILTDEEVRQGLKTYSKWPTFPQLYYKGELIGGCDIVLELHKNGELKETLSE